MVALKDGQNESSEALECFKLFIGFLQEQKDASKDSNEKEFLDFIVKNQEKIYSDRVKKLDGIRIDRKILQYFLFPTFKEIKEKALANEKYLDKDIPDLIENHFNIASWKNLFGDKSLKWSSILKYMPVVGGMVGKLMGEDDANEGKNKILSETKTTLKFLKGIACAFAMFALSIFVMGSILGLGAITVSISVLSCVVALKGAIQVLTSHGEYTSFLQDTQFQEKYQSPKEKETAIKSGMQYWYNKLLIQPNSNVEQPNVVYEKQRDGK